MKVSIYKIIAIFIALILLIGVSYFVGFLDARRVADNSNRSCDWVEEKVFQDVYPTPYIKKQVVTDTNSSTDWKTYVNAVHKYSVKYPPGWTIDTTTANNVENYDNSACCNTASLTISKGDTKWWFRINQIYTGFDAPDECVFNEESCTYSQGKVMQVLGYTVNSIVTRSKLHNQIIEVEVVALGDSHGFGKVGGLKTEWNDPEKIKYFLSYSGSNIDDNLDTLDQISRSLTPTN